MACNGNAEIKPVYQACTKTRGLLFPFSLDYNTDFHIDTNIHMCIRTYYIYIYTYVYMCKYL